MRIADPVALLEHLYFEPHARVADFGSGSGAYAKALASKMNGSGTLYVVDALPGMVTKVVKELEPTPPSVFGLHHDVEEELPLGANTLDAAIVANLMHAVAPHQRQDFVHELARVLTPEGEILFVDWAGSFNHMGPAPQLVATPADVVRMFRAADFTLSGMLPSGGHHYAFTAKRPPRKKL